MSEQGNPIYAALDTPNLDRALKLADAVWPHVGGLKVGLELFGAHGPHAVRRLSSSELPIFLDLKLHDIPNTVGKAVQALASLRPSVLTVHAGGGVAMMRAAKAAAPEGCRVVGVTVLTSLDESDLAATGVSGESSAQVARLADLARTAGLDGVVCSGEEVASLKARWSDGLFVVPGLRPEGGETGDQKRTVTPARALADGAGILVIGRPISTADDPEAAAKAIASTLRPS